MNRREALIALAAAGASSAAPPPPAPKICVFSKHFQWTDWKRTATLARQIGFDGVDFTVRAGGHVLPERVERDLPLAVEIAHKAGLETPMITAGIVDAQSPHAEAILKTASSLGIRSYRWGGFTYDYSRNLEAQLEALKPRVRALAELNQKYGVTAMYHTHSGPKQVGAPIWDIWTVLRDMDPRSVALNYDIGHATVEGGYGGWMDSCRVAGKFLRGAALKDFLWARNARGQWQPEWCPVGQGMVNFTGFFQVLKQMRFSGPLQLHFEYPLGGANDGKTTLEIPESDLIQAMRRDLEYVRGALRQAGCCETSSSRV